MKELWQFLHKKRLIYRVGYVQGGGILTGLSQGILGRGWWGLREDGWRPPHAQRTEGSLWRFYASNRNIFSSSGHHVEVARYHWRGGMIPRRTHTKPNNNCIQGSPARNMWTPARTASFWGTNSWWTSAHRTWLETIQFTILTLFNQFFTNINLFTCISKECQEAFTSTFAIVEIFLKLFWLI